MTDGENKNLEPQFDEEKLFRDIAEIVVVHGKINETDNSKEYDIDSPHRTSEDGRSFMLKELPPLSEAGIKEIEFVPEFTHEGYDSPNTLHVRFADAELSKSVIFTEVEPGRQMDVQVIVDHKADDEKDIDPWEDLMAGQAVENVLSGQSSDDPLVAKYEANIHFALTQDTAPSPEDMLAIEDANRRLKEWFKS